MDNNTEDVFVGGFTTLIHIDKSAEVIPYDVVIEVTDPEDIELQKKARALR